MISHWLILTAAITLGMATPAAATESSADELGNAVRSAVARVDSSVVRIQVVGHPDRAGRIVSRVTTGVVVSENGEIISSSFGFGGDAASVFVRTASGERFAAQVVATDQVRKLVLLSTEARGLVPPAWTQEPPPVGAWAIAVGRFYAAEYPSASLGIVSALNRVHGLAIQTDAKVSPVNYGGPLLTMDGEVAGILVPLSPGNDATGVAAGVGWYDSGIGFAIPAADVAESVRRLRSGQDRFRGLLGIRPGTRNPLSTDVVVRTVQPGSPAETAGIQVGDRIVAVNGQPIMRMGILQSLLHSSWAGDVVQLTLRRNGQEQTVEATLTDELTVPERGWLGIVPLQAIKESESGEPRVQAAVVSASAAADAGLPNLCLILEVEGEQIRSPRDLRRRLGRLKVGEERTITFVPVDGSAEPQTASVRAVPWVQDDRSELAAVRASVTPDGLPEWTQTVTDLRDERHVWMLGPADKPDGVDLGVVILLHDGQPEADALELEWRDVCREHQLILAVVYHEYSIPLDSVEVIGEVMSQVSRLGDMDPDRITLMTRESHASLVTRLLLDPRLAPLNQAVFHQCRPVTGGASLDVLEQKNASILLFPAVGDSQAEALTASAVRRLRTAGAAVTVRRGGSELSERRLANEIARWLLLQKIR